MTPRRRCPGRSSFDRVGRAFSLIELLLTIAIIAVLMVVIYGGNARSRQQKKIRLCARNLELIYSALQLYGNDHAGKLPEVTGSSPYSDEPLSALVPQYISLTAPFICPGSDDAELPEGQPFKGRRISYAYYMGVVLAKGRTPLLSDWQVDTSSKSSGARLFSADGKPPGNNHDKYGGNVLFSDGQVQKAAPATTEPLPLAAGVRLLNPRP